MAAPIAVDRPTVWVPPAVPLRELLPWAALVAIMAGIAVYFVGAEGGAASLLGGDTVHELVHDARHLLALPCH
ncbi:MAG: CbtB domain-containing protein [Actinomycetota bacterium]